MSDYLYLSLLGKLTAKSLHHQGDLLHGAEKDPFWIATQRPLLASSPSLNYPRHLAKGALFLIKHIAVYVLLSLVSVVSPRPSIIILSSLRWSNRSRLYKDTLSSIIREREDLPVNMPSRHVFADLGGYQPGFYSYCPPLLEIIKRLVHSLYSDRAQTIANFHQSLSYSHAQSNSAQPLPSFSQLLSASDQVLSICHMGLKFPTYSWVFSPLYSIVWFFSSILIKILRVRRHGLVVVDVNHWSLLTLLPAHLAGAPFLRFYGCQHGGGYWFPTLEPTGGSHRGIEAHNPALSCFISLHPFVNPYISASLILNHSLPPEHLDCRESVVFIAPAWLPLNNHDIFVPFVRDIASVLNALSRVCTVAVRHHPLTPQPVFDAFDSGLCESVHQYVSHVKSRAFSSSTLAALFVNSDSTLLLEAYSLGLFTAFLDLSVFDDSDSFPYSCRITPTDISPILGLLGL